MSQRKIIALAVSGLLAGLILFLAVPGLIVFLRPPPGVSPKLAALKSINQAEAVLQSQYKSYWTADVAGLYYSVPSGAPGPLRLVELAVADADPRPQGTYSKPNPSRGYWYKMLPVEGSAKGWNPKRYAAAAYPAEYGEGNRLTFITDDSCETWKKDLGAAVIEKFPADPSKEGWTKLD